MHMRTPLTIVAAALLLLPLGAAEPEDTAKPSQYAPAADLVVQVEEFVDDLSRDLEGDDYTEYQRNRVEMNAHTLIVISQILAIHDQDHQLKKAAPGMVEAAQLLAENAGDQAEAQAALKKFQEAMNASSGEETAELEPLAGIVPLMKQVPVLNNDLRRKVTGRRFERSIDDSAALAAALAAIGQASKVDTTYVFDEESHAAWQEICVDFRDASAAVNDAVRKKDKAAAEQALAKLVETCDACHNQFR